MPHTKETLDKMASEIFDLYLLIAIARSRRPVGQDDLSESEFVTLDVLSKEEPLTIGQIQKRVGVLPAQMSRIIRALEEQSGRGYVECRINPKDRRRVDVYLTAAGRKAHADYRATRLRSMHEVLAVLPPEDRLDFMRMLRKIHEAFEKRMRGG
ncbi:MAG: MarR family transcriptional regulator [Planctomycetota bacterium]|nr:MAG: MarR family transcriptional regulator [Planctomycetota bacterium]